MASLADASPRTGNRNRNKNRNRGTPKRNMSSKSPKSAAPVKPTTIETVQDVDKTPVPMPVSSPIIDVNKDESKPSPEITTDKRTATSDPVESSPGKSTNQTKANKSSVTGDIQKKQDTTPDATKTTDTAKVEEVSKPVGAKATKSDATKTIDAAKVEEVSKPVEAKVTKPDATTTTDTAKVEEVSKPVEAKVTKPDATTTTDTAKVEEVSKPVEAKATKPDATKATDTAKVEEVSKPVEAKATKPDATKTTDTAKVEEVSKPDATKAADAAKVEEVSKSVEAKATKPDATKTTDTAKVEEVSKPDATKTTDTERVEEVSKLVDTKSISSDVTCTKDKEIQSGPNENSLANSMTRSGKSFVKGALKKLHSLSSGNLSVGADTADVSDDTVIQAIVDPCTYSCKNKKKKGIEAYIMGLFSRN